MKKIGFVGAYDKTDFIIYIARILVALGNKVMVIDSTTNQKAKYIVPVINPTKEYVTDFEGIEVAVGFDNFESIKDYLGMPQSAVFYYDYMLIDIDSVRVLETFGMREADHNYFVTSLDLYSIKKGLEILSGIRETMNLTKIYFSKNNYEEEDDYFNYLALGYKVQWDEERIYFPLELGDQNVIYENQRVAKIKFKKLSNQYKESLMYIAETLVGEKEVNNLRRVFRQLEKGV